MNLYDVFTTPFKLSYTRTYTEPILTFKASYITTNIHSKTTKEEIFVLSKMYFDQLILKYKNYVIDGQQTTESSYKLTVGILEDDELKYKHIYSCFYNNIEDRISWENKYDDNFDIEGNFFVSIVVFTEVIPEDYDTNNEDETPPPIQKAITESECIICYENKPNMIFLECKHICVCNVCDSKGKFSKCPMCRTKIKNKLNF